MYIYGPPRRPMMGPGLRDAERSLPVFLGRVVLVIVLQPGGRVGAAVRVWVGRVRVTGTFT